MHFYYIMFVTRLSALDKEAERGTNVEKSLQDMKKQEEEGGLIHEKEQVDKEEEAMKRKGKIEFILCLPTDRSLRLSKKNYIKNVKPEMRKRSIVFLNL